MNIICSFLISLCSSNAVNLDWILHAQLYHEGRPWISSRLWSSSHRGGVAKQSERRWMGRPQLKCVFANFLSLPFRFFSFAVRFVPLSLQFRREIKSLIPWSAWNVFLFSLRDAFDSKRTRSRQRFTRSLSTDFPRPARVTIEMSFSQESSS